MDYKQIKTILSGKLPINIKFIIFLVLLKKKVLILKRGKFKGLKNIEGLEDYNIPAELLSSKNRKDGISGFARLRNGGEFLEQVIESHIPFLDEIILVDNNSEDNTREICKKLQKKYPKMIKIYQYSPYVSKLGSDMYKITPENSVHCFSYFSNWVLAKTKYKYVLKIDDDHLVIPEILKKITDDIRKNGLKVFLSIGLYNVIRKENQIYLPMNLPFAGLYGDSGFFPVNENIYFIKDKNGENFVHNLKIKYGGLGFFHLKFLKASGGTINYEGKSKETVLSSTKGKLYKLPQDIKSLFFSLFKI